jgi:ABC-type Fe3+ transport system permease subunit
MATMAKIVLPTFMAVVVGFMVGWWFEFGRLMREHRPNGCDGPCLFLASEYHDDALWVGVGAALVLGLLVFGLAVLVVARRRTAPRPSQDAS